MKNVRIILILIPVLIFVYTIQGCSKKESEVKDEKQKTEMKNDEMSIDTTKMVKDGAYFCPMHPLEQSNDKAKCPICKMDLITKKEHYEKMMKKHEDLENKYSGRQDAIHFEIKTSILKSWECEKLIKKALKDTPGILDFSLDLLDSKIHMYIDKNKTAKKDVEKIIADLGYDANDTKANPEAAAKLPAECK